MVQPVPTKAVLQPVKTATMCIARPSAIFQNNSDSSISVTILLLHTGKAAYDHQMWLKSSDHFERSLTLYSETLNDCALRCEDILVVNLTQRDMNPQKKAKFEEYSFVPDTMEYYQLLVTVIREVLACRVNCQRSMATIEGDFVNQFLSSQFHYLQFNYYKCT